MSPFFHHKDRLAEPPLDNPIPGQALVISGDTGYSALSWWSSVLRLQVTADGQAPVYADHECTVEREKTPFTGTVLPVDVDRDDPTRIRIRWDEVPTVDERIANRDPLIVDPESAWRTVLAADPRETDIKPSWGDGQIAGWPTGEALRHGRRAGTALVVAHSGDPAGHMAGGDFMPPSAGNVYRSGGTVETGLHTFLGWLLLCVIPDEGDRYGVHLKTKIKRARLGPVLPVTIDPGRPADIEIAWDYAPEIAQDQTSEGAQLADVIVRGGNVESGPEAAADALGQVDSPLARALVGRLARKGAVVITSSQGSADPTAPIDQSSALAQLEALRDGGALSDAEFEMARAKLG